MHSLLWIKSHLDCFEFQTFYQTRTTPFSSGEWLVEAVLGFFLHFCRVDKEDEMTCLIKGCNFVLRNIPHEAFVYAKHADSEFRFQTTQPDIFPYLLVNIGSGVSIVKVITTPEHFTTLTK